MPCGQLGRQFLYPPWCARVQGTLRINLENINVRWGRGSSLVRVGTAHFFSSRKCCATRERAPAVTSGMARMCPSYLMGLNSS